MNKFETIQKPRKIRENGAGKNIFSPIVHTARGISAMKSAQKKRSHAEEILPMGAQTIKAQRSSLPASSAAAAPSDSAVTI